MQHTITLLKHIRPERLIVWCEGVVLCALFMAYVYFVLLSIADIVLRKELIVSIQEMETEVSTLEAAYFARLDTITPATLAEYGLVKQEPTAYVAVIPTDRITKRD